MHKTVFADCCTYLTSGKLSSVHQASVPGTFCIACALLCCPSNTYQSGCSSLGGPQPENMRLLLSVCRRLYPFVLSYQGLRGTCYNVTIMCPFFYLSKVLLFLPPANFCPFLHWFIRKERIEKITRGRHTGSSKRLPLSWNSNTICFSPIRSISW